MPFMASPYVWSVWQLTHSTYTPPHSSLIGHGSDSRCTPFPPLQCKTQPPIYVDVAPYKWVYVVGICQEMTATASGICPPRFATTRQLSYMHSRGW